jgi:hypothetical protein
VRTDAFYNELEGGFINCTSSRTYRALSESVRNKSGEGEVGRDLAREIGVAA